MPAVVRARSRALCGLVAALLCFACSEATSSSEAAPLEGLVVSDAVTANGTAPTSAAAASRPSLDLTMVDPTAFVSLAPGSVPAGTVATIHDARNGQSISVPLVGGGFDPVGIVAAAGDTLDITITLSTGGLSLAKAVVPIRQPPRVVRTDPPHGRTDVAINATIVVIFSEPMDPGTVTTATFSLLSNGQPVPGAVRALTGSTVGIEFVPAAPLSPATDYELTLSDRITDLTGDRLAVPAVTVFATARTTQFTRRLAFTVQPHDAAQLMPFTPAIQVAVLDEAGNPDPSFTGPVALSLDPNPGNATLWGVPAVNAVGGIAVFPNLAVTAAGTGYRLSAASAGINGGVSSGFAILAIVAADGAWTLRAPPPTIRYFPQAAVVSGILYLIGGEADPDGVGLVRTVEAYDPATNTWTSKAPMPTARYNFGVGALDGIIYVAGGYENGVGRLQTLEAYDPATDTWTTRAPMPTARDGLGVGAVNGRLYAIGGSTYLGAATTPTMFGTVEAYDPVSNSWSVQTPMPTPRTGSTVVVVGGVILVGGGETVSGTTTALPEIYNPLSNSWTAGPSTWFRRAVFSAGIAYACCGSVDANSIYILGGIGENGPLSSVSRLELTFHNWTTAPPMPESGIAAAGLLNGVLYAVVNGKTFSFVDAGLGAWDY